MNEYSDLSDFSDDEWGESYHEQCDWEGEDHCNVDEDEVESENIKNKYLLVEWVQLESLLKKCLVCGRKAASLKTTSRGSLIKVHVDYEEHTSKWAFQSFRNGIAERNMALSAGIVLSGMTWSSFQRALTITGVQIIGEKAFYRTQKKYLFPAINYVYTERRNNIIQNLKTGNFNVIGDGRNDSPGHNSKYGSYTIMNVKAGEIIDFFYRTCFKCREF